MDYLNFLTEVVGKSLIYHPSLVTYLLFDIWADLPCSTPCTHLYKLLLSLNPFVANASKLEAQIKAFVISVKYLKLKIAKHRLPSMH